MRRAIPLGLSTLGALVLLLALAAVLNLSRDRAPEAAIVLAQAEPPLVPAFYWGEVLAAPPAYTPTVGLTVTAAISGGSCGSEVYTINNGGRVIYGIHVWAGGNCGVSGRQITFWIGSQLMAPTVEWPGSGAVVELDLWLADIVYADEAGVCGGYPACYERVQTAVDTVLADGRVYVYTGTYTDTTLHRSVAVTALGSITLTNVTILTGSLSAPADRLSLSGAMTYTDGTFSHRNGTVAFIGTTTQTIAGNVTFHDVVVSSTATVTTQSDVTVTGVCTHELGSVTEETKGVSGTGPIAFPLAGVTITPTVAGDLAGLWVRRVEEDHPLASPGSAVETGRYWRIEPTAGSVYSATLTLPHPAPPDANDRICRYDGTWDCAVHSYSVTDQTITRMYIDHFSDWMTGDDVPTAVDLVTFAAVPGCNEVVIRWETASEIDNLGFNVYRSQSPQGVYTKLNGALIPSQSPGSPFGAAYTWHDREVRPGMLYYRLEDVDIDGRRTWHGPVALDPSQALGCRVYLPLTVRNAP